MHSFELILLCTFSNSQKANVIAIFILWITTINSAEKL